MGDELSLANQVRATEENLWGLWERFGQVADGELRAEDGAVWFDTALSNLPYHGVTRFLPEAGVDAGALADRIGAYYRDRGKPFMWIVHPSARPADLVRMLEERGLAHAETVPGMAMDLEGLGPREACPEGVEIREATTPDEIAEVRDLIAWRWEIPEADRAKHLEISLAYGVGEPGSPFRVWVAYLDGKAVSKVVLNLDAEAAGIYGVATRPEARGKGLARILTLEALNVGREAGYRIGVLHASEMARGLYERIGFRQVSEFRVYASGGSFHT